MYRSVMLVLLGLWVGGSVFAAETESSAVVMDEVVVTAGRVAETTQEQTMSVTIIDAEEIEASPSKDLGDLLAEKGIGYIQKYPGAMTTASVRGFKTNAQNDLLGYSLVLLNGRRAGTGNLALIMTNDIERIEIIRGPGAVQYGSAAMGGVINVITRQGEGPLDAQVFGSLGSFDSAEAGARLSGDLETFDYSLGYSRSSMGDYRTGDGDRYHNTGFDSKQSYSLNLGYRFAETHRFGFSLNGTNFDKVGTPNYLSANDLDDYRDSDYLALDFTYTGESPELGLSWDVRFFDTETEDLSYISWTASLYGPAGELYTKSKTEQNGMQAQVAGEIDFVRLVAGVDWYDYDIESPFSPQRSTFDSRAGFLLAKSRFMEERLIVDAGLRYDTFEVELIEPTGTKEDHDNWLGSFGVAYLVNDAVKVRAHYGEAFKVPGADQLAANYTVNSWTGPERYLGNPDLDPESSRTYEVGVEYADQFFKGSLGYFITDFEDKITKVAIPGGFSWKNVGKAELSGVEAQVSADFAMFGRDDIRLQPYLNLTYFDRYRDLDNDRDLLYLNEMNASYGLGVRLPHELSAKINFAYHGSKLVEDWEGWDYMTPEPETVKVGGFTVVDLSIAQQLFDSRCTISASVGNLFNKSYSYVEGYPMPERNYRVNVSYRF